MIEAGNMPFGKHVGQPLSALEDHYVKWLFTAQPIGDVNIALQAALKTRYEAILAKEQHAKENGNEPYKALSVKYQDSIYRMVLRSNDIVLKMKYILV